MGGEPLKGIRAETKEQLDIRLMDWRKVILGVAVCLTGAYFIYFGLILNQSPALEADKWGTFGDFIGGIMNPIVAFAAFFWLTESVKLQKQELAETRAELKNAAEAQQVLAKNGRDSVRLAALTAVTNATQVRVDMITRTIDRHNDFLRRGGVETGLEAEVVNMDAYRNELYKDLEMYFEEMRGILDVASGRPPVVHPGGDVTYVS